MRRALLVLPLLVLTAAVSACGGSDTGGGGGAGGVDPRAAYVASATKVCQAAQSEAKALKAPTKPEEFKPFVDASVAIAQRAQAGLSTLTPPPADAAPLRSKVLDPFAALVVQGEAYAAKVTAAGTDQAKLLALLSEQPTPAGIDLVYLRGYGLDVCADVVSPG